METGRGIENKGKMRHLGKYPVILPIKVKLFVTAFSQLLLLATLVTMTACGPSSEGTENTDDAGPMNTTTTLSHLVEDEVWLAQAISLEALSGSSSTHDIIIRLEDDEPVKEITLKQVLLIDSSSDSAELEISGSSYTSETTGETTYGKIRICNLVFIDVDAEHFEVHDTDVVQLEMFNVSVESDLDIQITPVNTVRCGRGGTSVLSLGEEIPLEEEQIALGEVGRTLSIVTSSGRQGLRANRIRILGPSGGDGFIENLIIEKSSVFGRIKLEHLEIQRIFMENVTIEYNSI